MALLEEAQIGIILDSGRNYEIEQAVKHEDRLRLHSESTITRPNNNAFTEWLENMPNNILPRDKFQTFQSLITYPLPTVEVTEEAFKELFRVHFATNRVIDYEFNDNELKEDFVKYLNYIGEPDFYKQEGYNLFQNQINALIVVDLPLLEKDVTTGEFISESDFPEPYFYVVHTERINQIENNVKGDCEWVFYTDKPKPEEKKEGVFEIGILLDDGYYRRYKRGDKQTGWQLDIEVPHDLGRVPARQFWTTPLGTSKVQKKNPITPNLGGFDWHLFSIIEERHLSLYAGFPIVTIFEEKCTYRTSDGLSKTWCEEGYLWVQSDRSPEPVQTDRACPKCNGGQFLAGPGSVLKAPAPLNKETEVGMPGITVTKGDVEALEYMDKKLLDQAKILLYKIVGSGGEAQNDQAKNQKQIQSGYESKQTVLDHTATNFEKIQKFIIDTVGSLRYGDRYLGSIVDWGDQFFLLTGAELQDAYSKDRENSMPFFEFSQDRNKIYKKRYKNNPEQIQRTMILKQLEPLQDLSLKEIDNNTDIITKEQRVLKINFNSFISRFERENGSINEYLNQVEFEVRVASIRQQLDLYVQEVLDKIEEETPEPPSLPPAGPEA